MNLDFIHYARKVSDRGLLFFGIIAYTSALVCYYFLMNSIKTDFKQLKGLSTVIFAFHIVVGFFVGIDTYFFEPLSKNKKQVWIQSLLIIGKPILVLLKMSLRCSSYHATTRPRRFQHPGFGWHRSRFFHNTPGKRRFYLGCSLPCFCVSW